MTSGRRRRERAYHPPYTILTLQSREMLRLALGEPIELLEVGREGVVWTATSGQNQNQGTSQKKAKTVVDFFFFGLN